MILSPGLRQPQNEQIRTIEAARTIMKKRRGVTFFVRHFPVCSPFFGLILTAYPTTSDLCGKDGSSAAHGRWPTYP